MKKQHPIFSFFIYSILFIFFLVVGTYLFVNSRAGQNLFKEYLLKEAKAQNVEVTIDRIFFDKGINLHFTKISLPISKYILDCSDINLRLNPFLLLIKKFYFSSLTIEKATLFSQNTSNINTSEKMEELIIPAIKISSIQIRKAIFNDLLFTIYASLKTGKNFSSINLLLNAKKENDNFALTLKGNKKTDLLKFGFKTERMDLSLLKFQIPFSSNFSLISNLRGSYLDFLEFFKSLKTFKLFGNIEGTFNLTNNFLEKIFSPKTPFKGELTLFSDGRIDISSLSIENENIDLVANASLEKFELSKAHLHSNLRDLAIISPLGGSLDLSFDYQKPKKMELKLFSPKIYYNKGEIESFNSIFLWKDSSDVADTKINFNFLQNSIEISLLSFFSKDEIKLSSIQTTSSIIEGTGELMIKDLKWLEGKLFLTLNHFPFDQFLSSKFFIKKAQIDLDFSTLVIKDVKNQFVLSNMEFFDFSLEPLFISKAMLTTTCTNLFLDPKWSLILEAQKGSLARLNFQEVFIKTSNLEKENPLEVSLSGNLKDPFRLSLLGKWGIERENYFVNLTELNGEIFREKYRNLTPISLYFSKDTLEINDLSILIKNEPLKMAFLKKDKELNFSISSSYLPLDFLSFTNINLTVEGHGKIDGWMKIKENVLSSKLELTLDELTAYPFQKKESFSLNGKVLANVDNNLLNLDSKIFYKENKELLIKGTLPLEIKDTWIQISPQKSLFAQAELKGKLEEIFDFFDLGTHQIQGDVNLNLELQGTLEKPLLKGDANLAHGYYENYETGTIFREVEGKIEAYGNKIYISSLKGKDSQKGSLEAVGEIELSLKKDFPFLLKATLNDLLALQNDIAEAKVEGKVEFIGNLKSAKILGNLTLKEGDLSILEKLKEKPEDIPFIFVPPRKEKLLLLPSTNFFYPITLNLSLFIPSSLSIHGAGLSSTWDGEVKLLGELSSLAVKGKIHLKEGEFVFASKTFTLKEGSIEFTEDDRLALIKILGNTTIQGIYITASLLGPLFSPQITFSSSPPLPMSSLLAFILFGQDISEITALQAVELTTTMASLGTGGQNILEATRKKLGIDRLAVITTQTKNLDQERTTIQIGKYVAKGVLVTYSQGLEQESSNIIVEVDLGHGFTFQGETCQEEEQGKFTIKWNHNY